MLSGVEAVIVDEIHAVAATKRGSHLALTLERLEAQARAGRPAAHACSGSACQRDPEPARGDRPLPRRPPARGHDRRRRRPKAARPADRGAGRVDGRTGGAAATGATRCATRWSRAGGESTRGSIWPAIYPELLRLVREHNSTIVFVNNRRSAERVALRLNELAAARERRATAASGGAPRRSPAPTTARSRARSARRSRSC